MERSLGKISRVAPCLALAVCLFALTAHAQKSAEDVGAKIRASGIRVPIYQSGRDIPLIILTSDEAKPVGVRFEMRGVKLVWLGDSFKDIRGIVRTPIAVFDQSTNTVAGGEKITYESDEIDIEGIGFDIDNEKKTLHVRSSVVVTIKGDLSSSKQLREANESKQKKGGLTLRPSDGKEKAPTDEGASELRKLLTEINKPDTENPDNKDKEKEKK